MKNKRLFSYLLIMTLVFTSFLSSSGLALAAEMEGAGTQISPYLIKTAVDLYSIPNNSTSHYKLANDIDLVNVKKEPIGQFAGVLDGDGYAIKNLNIVGATSTPYIGLFSQVENAVFKNLVFYNANVSSSGSYTGVITGYAFNTRFENCSVTDSRITGTSSYSGFLGGYMEVGTVSKCISENNTISGGSCLGTLLGMARRTKILNSKVVNPIITGTGSNIGSLCGQLYEYSTVSNCTVKNPKITAYYQSGALFGYVYNNVTLSNSNSVEGTVNNSYTSNCNSGGLIGYANNNVNLKNCYTTTDVTAAGQYVGGMLGYIDYTISIEECYALNNVKGKSYVGGLVGFMVENARVRLNIANSYHNGSIICTDTTNGIAGGVISNVYGVSNLTIKNSYIASSITAKTKYAMASNGTITDSYFDGEVIGITTPISQARSTDILYKGVNFPWDFDKIWIIDEGNDYPRLRSVTEELEGEENENPEVPENPTPSTSVLKVVLEPTELLKLSIDEDLDENTKVIWSSSDSSIATVDLNGNVKAITRGNTIVTAKTSDGFYEETIKVLVVDNASKYRLTIDLNVDEKCRLTIDEGKDIASATWSAMDSSIASVTDNGKVTAVSKGLTIVTATDKNGKEVGQVYIRVR